MKLYIKSILILFAVLSTGNLYAKLQGQALIDSMLKELPRQKEDTNKINLLSVLSGSYESINPDEGLKFGKQCLELATTLGWKKGVALAYASLGSNCETRSEFPKALEYYFMALKIYEESGDKRGVGSVTGNIGIIYYNQKNYATALEYYFKGLKLAEELGDKRFSASAMSNISLVYRDQKDYPKSLEYGFMALKLYEEMGNKVGIAKTYGNIGGVYHYQKNYTLAIEYKRRALKIDEELGAKHGIASNLYNIGDTYIDIVKDTETKAIKLTTATELSGYKYEGAVSLPKGKAALLAGAIDHLQRSLVICKEIRSLSFMKLCYTSLTEAYKLKGDYKQALEYQTNAQAIKDSVFSQDNREQIIKLEMKDQYGRQRLTDSLKTEAREKIMAIQIQKQRTYTYLGIVGILVLAGFSFFIVKERGKSERERKKSDKLLLNILPAEVAQELKVNGSSEARDFDNVTVLFTDFVNFTAAGERMSAKVLVDELHNCFKAFDDITNKYRIEKIKTIGDAYLAVAGLPTADPKHAENAVRAAIEINDFMQDRIAKLGERTFAIRIGIHSGSVVAGIVGVKKFAYDIWGDAVNTAARMEQNSEAGKINISETTYELVKDKFTCEYRGEIDAKGKGVMKMYYVG